VRRCSDGVVDDSVAGWSRHALSSSHRDEIELVDVLVCDRSVHNGSRERVLEAANISSEESGVDSLAGVDVDQLGGFAETQARECLLDLVDLSPAESLDLALTNTVPVEDDLSWVAAVGSLEGLTG